MTLIMLQQFKYERETWSRLLNYLEEENILYKNRIAVILKKDTDNMLIEMIEIFLNKFVLEDAIIAIFRHEISSASKKIPAIENGIIDKSSYEEIVITQNKLRSEIEIIEQQFNRLKFEFNKYMSKAS